MYRSLLSLGSACALLMGAAAFVSPAAIAGTLDAKTSEEMQKLLATQVNAKAVHFNDRVLPRTASNTYERLLLWHQIALDTTAIDHTPVLPGENRVFGEQFGPHRSSRAMAIIHIGVFEAVNAVTQTYQSYVGLAGVSGDVSTDYAIAQAAHDTLVWLYPSQKPRLDALLALDAVRIPGDAAGLAAGQALGAQAAAAIIALRTNDGSGFTEPTVGVNFTPIGGIGHWTPDPVSGATVALGAYWGGVKPFVIPAGNTYRPAPPPALTSGQYSAAYKYVAAYGGDPANGTPTKRTTTETLHGIFWTYDGAPGLCAPPRMYNQLVTTLALTGGLSAVQDMARYLALVNTAMADAGIAAWDAKWYYQFWRPVTGIRNGDADGNPQTVGNPTWYPLGGQATNSTGPNFTPPFPAYPSGHATFGGAVFQVLRHFYPDNTAFTFTSDEFNGQNVNDLGMLQPLHPLKFSSLTAAEYDNSESRIYVGVHWQFDADTGVNMGNLIGDYVFAHAFQPVAVPAVKKGGLKAASN